MACDEQSKAAHPESPSMNIKANKAASKRLSESATTWLALASLLLPIPAARAQVDYATPYTFITIAGAPFVAGSANGTGAAARFNAPYGTAVDTTGNVYVADSNNNTIRKITPAGVVTTLAGTPGVAGSADGTGPAAQFNAPIGIAVDGGGNVYVGDFTNETIRKITPTGVVTTLAGTAGVAGTVDATGTAAQFSSPAGVAVDGSGNVYVVDQTDDTIRKVTPAGVVTTLAGTASTPGTIDGTGTGARFSSPYGIASTQGGTVYVADTANETIRMITPAGVVTTIAGTAKSEGSMDGTGSAARFKFPIALAVDRNGNVYVADYGNDTIRLVSSAGVVTTLAGKVGVTGYVDGTGSAAEFNSPWGVSVDGSDNVYVGDLGNNTIRKITPAAVVSTLAGTPRTGHANGTGSAAAFGFPSGIAVDSSGNMFVADQVNDEIRKITPSGVVTTLAGSPGNAGSADGTGSAAQFNYPFGVAVDGSGNVYVADAGNDEIRKVTPGGTVTTVAGSPGQVGNADGTGSSALFDGPLGLVVDGNGNIYVSDTSNDTIRKITPAGVVTTLAGTEGTAGSSDGTGTGAQFDLPAGIALDKSGNLYVANAADTIRKVTPAGVVSTLAGIAEQVGSVDGPDASARFDLPVGIAVNGSGNVYVADTGNDLIRKVTPAGAVTTLAGVPTVTGHTDGTGSVALFNGPEGLAIDSVGNLYVADTSNGTIRKGSLSGAPQILTQPTDQYVSVGGSSTFSVTAEGSSGLTYQWKLNGAPISGATGSSYTVVNAQAADAGAYTVTITDSDGSVTSAPANLSVNTGSSSARLINISTRAMVGTGANILIPGFVINGSGIETLLIRADGPALTQFSVPGVLAQPSLSVFNSAGTKIASNTVWGTNSNPSQLASVAASVGAFPFASGSADCAVLVNLTSGAYTVQVSGVNNTSGVALAEVYEVSSTGTKLVNISTRAKVGTGGNILIPGFVISGSGTEELLVRGDGPSLTQFSVSGVLAQVALGVYSGSTVIASNTGWGTSANPGQIASVAAQVGAFALAADSGDSAQIVNLAAGPYTIQISGVNNSTGVALAEVYNVP
jgi:streptogramin lyase